MCKLHRTSPVLPICGQHRQVVTLWRWSTWQVSLYYNIIILRDHCRICSPSLTKTSLCDAWLYTTVLRPHWSPQRCHLWKKFIIIANMRGCQVLVSHRIVWTLWRNVCWILHLNNAPSHTSHTLQQFLVQNQIPITPSRQILEISNYTTSGTPPDTQSQSNQTEDFNKYF